MTPDCAIKVKGVLRGRSKLEDLLPRISLATGETKKHYGKVTDSALLKSEETW